RGLSTLRSGSTTLQKGKETDMNASTKTERLALAAHDEESSNSSGNPSLMDIVGARLSRRNVLKAGVGTAGAAVFGALAGCGGGSDDTPDPADAPITLGFAAVAKNTDDVVT